MKQLLVIAMSVILLPILILTSCADKSNYNTLLAQYEQLRVNYTNLQARYNDLLSNYETLNYELAGARTQMLEMNDYLGEVSWYLSTLSSTPSPNYYPQQPQSVQPSSVWGEVERQQYRLRQQ